MDGYDAERHTSEWKAMFERGERMRRHARVHFAMSMLVVAINIASLFVPRSWHSYVVLAALSTCVVLLVSALRDMSGVLYGYRTEPRIPEMIGPAKATAMQVLATLILVAFVAMTVWSATWHAAK